MPRDVKYPTRFTLIPGRGCSDDECWRRSCMAPGLDKGSFSPGRGYTSYYEVPIPICMTRHVSGCPTFGTEIRENGLTYGKKLEPDTEHARCCGRPAYPTFGPRIRTCTNCHAEAPVKFTKLLNALPTIVVVPRF
jgi:hypothetical protein